MRAIFLGAPQRRRKVLRVPASRDPSQNVEVPSNIRQHMERVRARETCECAQGPILSQPCVRRVRPWMAPRLEISLKEGRGVWTMWLLLVRGCLIRLGADQRRGIRSPTELLPRMHVLGVW